MSENTVQEDFLEKMKEVLDTESSIDMKTDLKDIEEWDSLSFVSFLAMVSTTYEKKIAPPKVRAAETIQDLYELITGE